MRRDNNYKAGNLLDYEYFSKHYTYVAIELSKQIKLENLDLTQHINFVGRLDIDNGATLFFVIVKSEETTFGFSRNAVSII